MLLPCDHIFCCSCVPISNLFGLECPLCKQAFSEQELRQALFIENVVNIYRSLDASFSTHILNSDFGRVSEKCRFSGNTNATDQLGKRPVESSPVGNSTCRPSIFSLVGDKHVQVPRNSSVVQLEKSSCFADSGMRNMNKDQNFRTFKSNPSSVISPGPTRCTQQEQHEAVDLYINQSELTPNSPPSSGASKGVEVDGIEPGTSDDTAGKCTLKKCTKRNVDDFGTQCIDERHLYFKKQKQLNHYLPETQEGQATPMVMNQKNSASDGSDNTKFGSSYGDRLAAESDSSSSVNFICAFCQTWKITEGSGPMQHFADGKQVVGSEAGRSNVIHVHKSCIEWAPQIFYESDTVIKNLDKELARAAKLKCTSCGLKGAALGCFAKSCRRTYHVPCAYEISACRWDSYEFLMLCPSHASHKFPSERFKKLSAKKCTSSTQKYDENKTLDESDFWETTPTEAKNWVLCGSSLSADEKLMMVKFARLCGATVVKAWNPNVTHVIAATDANGACSRTLKVLMAILKGRWILKTDWIKECMQSKSLVAVGEEPYEVGLDNHGCCDGPKTGRLRALNNAPGLFSGLGFYFNGEFVVAYKNGLHDLIVTAGGTIVETKEQLRLPSDTQSSDSPSPTTLVVYYGDSVMGSEDASDVLQRQAEAERVASETGSRVIAHTWVLDSIASVTLQPFAQR